MNVFALNCTLKASGSSSTELMLRHCLEAFAVHDDVEVPDEIPRVVDHQVAFGVTSDEGDGDEWPALRQQILDADIFVLGTPIWMGHPASVCQLVLERLDAFLAETADDDRMIAYDRVAVCAVVGNEDGAHHTGAAIFQALNDVGFTIPAGGMTYWVGEAMDSVDYQDLDEIPDAITATTETMAQNAVHLARLLAGAGYPKQAF